MRLLFYILLFYIIGISFSFSIIDSEYDDIIDIDFSKKTGNCKYISTMESYKKNWNFSKNKIFKEKIFNKALENLKKYCNGDGENVLKSDSLANHIIDVGFRVLDGFGGKYSYGLAPDPKSKQRREYLNNIMKEHNTKPQDIKDKFFKFRGENIDDNIIGGEKTIYSRYLLFCNEIDPLYDKILSSSNFDNYSVEALSSNYSKSCRKLAKDIYIRESYMIIRVMFMNIYTHINQTLYKGFTQEFNLKWARVYDKFLVLLGNYEYVVRRFIHATDVNTK